MRHQYQEEDEAGARPDLQDLKRLHRIPEQERDEAGEHHEGDCHAPSDIDVMLLRRIRLDEAAADVVHDVGRAPIQMRADGRHVGGGERSDDQPEQAMRHEHKHGRISEVVADDRRLKARKRARMSDNSG